MTNNEEILWEKVLDNAIDESLRTEPNNSLGITMQTIVNARKYVQGEEFDLVYKILHGCEANNLVGMLGIMWVELVKNPSRSELFRSFFNPDVGGLHEMQGICLKHPEDWFWTRLTGFIEKWQQRGALKIDNIEDAAKFIINLLKGHSHFELSIGLIDKVSDEDLKASVKSSVAIFLKLYRA